MKPVYHSRRSHPKHVGSNPVKRVQGGVFGANAPGADDVRPMQEIEGVGRFAERENKGGKRSVMSPLNPNAKAMLAALGGDWELGPRISERAGLTSRQGASALRELKFAGLVESRQIDNKRYGGTYEFRLTKR
jgi:hypothetical protein